MPKDTVIVGIAGAGKTSYAMDVLEKLMKDGVNPMKIGFCSFSRAACAEAAMRAEKVTGVRQIDLQKVGWFRTIHSAVLRSLGIDRDAILDHDSDAGQKWMDEHCLSGRVQSSGLREKGTLAAFVGDALSAWDNHRSRLNSTVPPPLLTEPKVKSVSYSAEELTSPTARSASVQAGQNEGTVGDHISVGTHACVDTLRAKNAEISPPKDENGDTRGHTRLARVSPLLRGKTLGDSVLGHTQCLYRAKINFILERGSLLKSAYFENRVSSVDKSISCSEIPMNSLYKRESLVGTHEMIRVSPCVPCVDTFLNACTLHGSQVITSAAGHAFSAEDIVTKWWSEVFGCRESAAITGEQFEFIARYESMKKIYGKMDFVDLLLAYIGVEYGADGCLRHSSVAGNDVMQVSTSVRPVNSAGPHGPAEALSFWLFDEYQDCSVLLDMCVQRLSEDAQERWFLGDRFQCIYDFNASDEACVAHREVEAHSVVLLNRTWRNPECVLEWGEEILHQDKRYVSRCPLSETDIGSVGLMEQDEFYALLPMLGREDVMILGRTWYHLETVKTLLNGAGVPWKSMADKHGSRWDSPAKLAYTLVMRDLAEGRMISEQDWRRVTQELPAKMDGREVFVRGTKARWAKMECSQKTVKGIDKVSEWGASHQFFELIRSSKWKTGMPLLLSEAIDRFGVDIVRNPRVRVGTCHSAKGLESENVFCIAKSSPAAAEQEEICLKYVTITRSSRNYRLVVDPLDLARDMPLFWAAPRNARFVKGIDLGIRKDSAGEMFGLAEDNERRLERQNCREPHAEEGNARHPDVHPREVRQRGIESSDRNDVASSTSPAGTDQECWWDL